MSRWRWRLIAAVLLVVCVVSSLVVHWGGTSAQPPSPTSSAPVVSHSGPRSGAQLAFRPVTKRVSGRCGQNAVPVESSPETGCLVLGKGLTVHHFRSATLAEGPSGAWTVKVTLDRSDAERLGAMTARLAEQHYPRDCLAVLIEDPPRTVLLSAPVVDSRLGGTVVIFAGTKPKARQVLDQLGG